jgi:hypothetical protein
VRIFRYYKDLINFKEKGDPAQLLKSVNPGEASLLDGATKSHIRFRLGGDVRLHDTNRLEIPPADLLQDFRTWWYCGHQCLCAERLRQDQEGEEESHNQHTF